MRKRASSKSWVGILYVGGASFLLAQSTGDTSSTDLKPPVHYWKFDEVSDSHVSPDAGTEPRSAPAKLIEATLVPGKYGQAVQFAATSDAASTNGDQTGADKGNTGSMVNIPVDLSGLVIKGLTVSLWFKGELPKHDYSSLFSDARSKGLEIRINTMRDILVNTSTSWNLLKAPNTVPSDPSIWTHVAVVCADNKVQLYVNGVLADSKDDVQPPFFTDRVTLGGLYEVDPAHPNDTAGFMFGFVGALDDVRIYDSALTADQILALSKATSPPDSSGGLGNP